MIFITVGTQPNGFNRCLQEVEKLIEKYSITEDIVAQIGYSDFYTDKFKIIDFLSENDFKEYINKASIVITHAGSGAIFNAIKCEKKIIAIARLHDYNEMADNHQCELVEKLSSAGYILNGTTSLEAAWLKLDDFKPRKGNFKNEIVHFLDNYINSIISTQ